jgi:hypothetical protein
MAVSPTGWRRLRQGAGSSCSGIRCPLPALPPMGRRRCRRTATTDRSRGPGRPPAGRPPAGRWSRRMSSTAPSLLATPAVAVAAARPGARGHCQTQAARRLGHPIRDSRRRASAPGGLWAAARRRRGAVHLRRRLLRAAASNRGPAPPRGRGRWSAAALKRSGAPPRAQPGPHGRSRGVPALRHWQGRRGRGHRRPLPGLLPLLRGGPWGRRRRRRRRRRRGEGRRWAAWMQGVRDASRLLPLLQPCVQVRMFVRLRVHRGCSRGRTP